MMFTEKEIKKLMKETNRVLKKYEDSGSAIDVMAMMYAENLPNKTETQGRIMAESIVEDVREFDTLYQSVIGDFDLAARRYLYDGLTGKTLRERCELLKQLSYAVALSRTALQEGKGDFSGIAEKANEITVSEQEATFELEEQLMDTAIDELKHSGLLTGSLKECVLNLNKMESNDVSEILTGFVGCEVDYRAMLTMMAYIKIKNGELKDVPPILTASQVSAMVCAGMEQMVISEKTAGGFLTAEKAELLVHILGTVVLLMFTASCLAYIAIPSLITAIFAGVGTALAAIYAIASIFGLTNRFIESKQSKLPSAKYNSIHLSAEGMERIAEYSENSNTEKKTEENELAITLQETDVESEEEVQEIV